MKNDDGVAAAKARLIEVAGRIDPLAPVRRHPYLTAVIAGAAIALLSLSTEKLKHSTSLMKWLVVLYHDAIAAIERFKTAAPAEAGSTPQT
jgi:hypothetical protein